MPFIQISESASPLDQPQLKGVLRVCILQIRGVEEEDVFSVRVALGSSVFITPQRAGCSALNDVVFFPVFLNQDPGELQFQLLSEGEKLQGTVGTAVSSIISLATPHDVWLNFEKFGGIHLEIVFQVWPLYAKRRGRIQDPYYGDMKLHEIYAHQCMNYGIKKPNSTVTKLLRAVKGVPSVLTTFSFDKNLLGDKGLLPVLEVVCVCEALTTLNLDSNALANHSAEAMLRMLRRHPSLETLSVCDNDFYEEAGNKLLMLIRVNSRITTLKIWGNRFSAYLSKRLGRQAEMNKAQYVKQREARKPLTLFALSSSEVHTIQTFWKGFREDFKHFQSFLMAYEKSMMRVIDAPRVQSLFSLRKWMTSTDPALPELPPPVDDSLQFSTILENALAILHQRESLEPMLLMLGKEYAVCGLQYSLVQGCFMEALQEELGTNLPLTTDESFQRALSFITRTMEYSEAQESA